MRIICGGDTGLVKVVHIETQEVVQQWGDKQDKSRSVSHMCWAEPGNEAEIVVARQNGSVEGYFPSTGELRYVLNRTGSSINKDSGAATTTAAAKPSIGLYSELHEDKRNVYLCTSDGQIEINRFDFDDSDSGTRNLSSVKQSIWRAQGIPQVPASAPYPPVNCMRVLRKDNATVNIALSGKDNLLKIYDAEKQKPVFKARNAPNDYLGLQAPVWDRDLTWLLTSSGVANPNLIATCTAHHQVRLYDIRDKTRRYIQERSYDDERGGHAFSCIAPSRTHEMEVFVGSITGTAYRLQFAGTQTAFAAFKGHAGSVRQMEQHPTDDRLVCSAAADRFVRVSDRQKRNVLYQMYLVQIQNAMLVTSDPETKPSEEDDEEDKDGESDAEGGDDEDGPLVEDVVVYGDEDDDEAMAQGSDDDSEDEGESDEEMQDGAEGDDDDDAGEDSDDEDVWNSMDVREHKDSKAARAVSKTAPAVATPVSNKITKPQKMTAAAVASPAKSTETPAGEEKALARLQALRRSSGVSSSEFSEKIRKALRKSIGGDE